MYEAVLRNKAAHPKTKRHTRRQLHQLHAVVWKEQKRAAKREAKRLQHTARRETRVLGVFEGCDPERTLALIGEEM